MKKVKHRTIAREGTGTRAPTLRFGPTAWAKLLFLRDFGGTEVGGFGIAAQGDLLFVEDIRLVEQECSWAHVAFDDESVADFFDQQVDEARHPEQFGRLWVHTHPGDCPRPSATDEKTFARVFGRAEWAVMFILARGGQTYARLRFNVGPSAEIELPVSVDYSRSFGACEHDDWEQEYLVNVQAEQPERDLAQEVEPTHSSPFDEKPTTEWYDDWFHYVADGEDVEEVQL